MKSLFFYSVLLLTLVFFHSCCKKPDLIVEDLEVTWTDTQQEVSFNVHNVGKGDAGEFLVYVNPKEDPESTNHRPQLRETITELAAGEIVEFNNLDLSQLAHPDNNMLGNVYEIVVLADPKGQIDECEEENNSAEEEVSPINIECARQTGFEPLTNGTQYTTLNTTFSSDMIDFKTVQFIWSNGSPSPSGYAEVQDNQNAGGTGHDIWTNNMNIEIVLPIPANSISFDAGHYGGNMNLSINGSLQNFNDVTTINNTTLGGVTIVAAGSKNNPGKWEFEGEINSFHVGGQEFVMDNVCIK